MKKKIPAKKPVVTISSICYKEQTIRVMKLLNTWTAGQDKAEEVSAVAAEKSLPKDPAIKNTNLA
ncbi:hypothetical protein HanRHA438_Chr15g0718751 [Helianthus annuus]|nr:hypothetical protein HanRHA438_Chr15g0718751 [Helianthus annuus]